jgi:hypothetical protein
VRLQFSDYAEYRIDDAFRCVCFERRLIAAAEESLLKSKHVFEKRPEITDQRVRGTRCWSSKTCFQLRSDDEEPDWDRLSEELYLEVRTGLEAKVVDRDCVDIQVRLTGDLVSREPRINIPLESREDETEKQRDEDV